MEEPIYIFGHKNPDADSICSALAYEAFQHAIGKTHYVAARCGNSNARIDTILKQFQLPLPLFVGDVTPRIGDVMHTNVYSVTKESTYAEALELIDLHDVRALPVVDASKKVEGSISIFDLGEAFIPKPKAGREMRRVYSSISAIIKSLNAEVLHVSNSDNLEDLYVRVGAMDVRSFGQYHHDEGTPAESSIIIVGDRWDIQERCLQLGVRLLVITGGAKADDDVVERAKRHGVSIIVSPYDSASTAWIIRTATHIDRLVEPNVKRFLPEDKISSVKGRVANSNDPLYMVVNEHEELVGVFSKSDLLRPSPKRIALVDHNELGQAVNGASQVQIVEIIDHHRLGNIPTEQPILFLNRPVGSTCSIVADMFRGHGLTPESAIAGVLMSGIISDTLHLNSPTTTPLEGELLDWLAPIAGITAEALADLIFSSGSVILSSQPAEVICSDCKVYNEEDFHYSVSQIEEMGFNNFWKHVDALEGALKDYCEQEGLMFSVLLVTDINKQNSLLVVGGNDGLCEVINYPNKKGQDNIFDLQGVVSRKKQLIPYLSTLLKNSGWMSNKSS
ncbi:MAG: putative manganese-dependent inorganic diphosphatase [Lentimonas sp.]